MASELHPVFDHRNVLNSKCKPARRGVVNRFGWRLQSGIAAIFIEAHFSLG